MMPLSSVVEDTLSQKVTIYKPDSKAKQNVLDGQTKVFNNSLKKFNGKSPAILLRQYGMRFYKNLIELKLPVSIHMLIICPDAAS